MAEDLARLPALYDGCFHEIACASRSSISRTGLRGPRKLDQFNEEAAEAREDIHGVLRSWACVAAERLGLALPESSVGALVAFLVSHLDWLTSFAAAPEFAAEIAGLCSRAEQVTNTELAALAAGVSPATIRQWGQRGKLTRYGSPGRAEFDIAELLAVTRRGKG
ncbi:hypothetical protein [Streptomyces kasugaensis]|uniref:hypothetical protein n=1 Tax=Streptomyces kasugaensis TaxID=1946 RepID=UPI001A93BAA9|nr:hypothetical protein [Streptomyces kasugaensis]